jgi:AbrB family looped-hinge helix DNA binding protein
MKNKEYLMRGGKNKKFYGSVTVSDRGQIVIPAAARKDFDINIGDKLLVLGDLDKGIALAKSNFIMKMMESTLDKLHHMEKMVEEEADADFPAED